MRTITPAAAPCKTWFGPALLQSGWESFGCKTHGCAASGSAGGGPIAAFYPDLCSASLVPGEHLRKEDSHNRRGMPVATTLPHSKSLPHNRADLHPSLSQIVRRRHQP